MSVLMQGGSSRWAPRMCLPLAAPAQPAAARSRPPCPVAAACRHARARPRHAHARPYLPTPCLPPPPAAIACKRDVDVRCKDVTPDDEAGVLHCLRRLRPQLSGRCQVGGEAGRGTSRHPRAAAAAPARCRRSARVAYTLPHACVPPRAAFRPPPTPVHHHRRRHHLPPLHTPAHACPPPPSPPLPLQALVAELEADASDDFRLDYKLFHACAADKSRLCPEAGFRGGEVQVGRGWWWWWWWWWWWVGGGGVVVAAVAQPGLADTVAVVGPGWKGRGRRVMSAHSLRHWQHRRRCSPHAPAPSLPACRARGRAGVPAGQGGLAGLGVQGAAVQAGGGGKRRCAAVAGPHARLPGRQAQGERGAGWGT